jgi:Polyketide cyclase / dehydrase and lipid transport
MKVLKLAAFALLGLLLLVAAVGLFLPRDWSVERSIVIQASPETIHPWVDSPAKWKEWFDFSEMGEMAVEVSGPASGVGATYVWTSPASNGRMTIVESDPKTGVRFDEAIESDSINAHGSILFAAEGAATRVTWSDKGDPDALPPVIGGLFRGMLNASIGSAFEKGLANLKTKVEAAN